METADAASLDYPVAPRVVDIFAGTPVSQNGCSTYVLHARSFTIAWSVAAGPDASLTLWSPAEYMLLLPEVGATLSVDGEDTVAPGRSVCILPAGLSSVRLQGAGECLRLFNPPPDAAGVSPLEGAIDGGPVLRPVTPYRRIDPSRRPVVHVLDELPNSPGMPRAKLFQSATMSINWVDYAGARDRTNLSPHSHVDIEQASIALRGHFIHHFRTSWQKDATAWQPDRHIEAGPGTVALIPPPIIHTSEGVGDERHILIDLFAPPRADFIAKGQILNAADYEAP